jgi:hypothetical protein
MYSADLSAMFDLVRPGIFVKKALQVIPEEHHDLIHLVHDFITGPKAYVELNTSVSTIFELPLGCPQGSTLGPKVFNIYCHDLIDNITEGSLISYADDSY